METMRVPNILLKVASRIARKKLKNRTGVDTQIEFNDLHLITGDVATTLDVHTTITVKNQDVARLLEELGIM